ncbi:UNVERIFIED_CONTAM: hypothetical protein GTU68_014141 [Idotea baltica]|nr:hypothetical protein [Idotea baltica]
MAQWPICIGHRRSR